MYLLSGILFAGSVLTLVLRKSPALGTSYT